MSRHAHKHSARHRCRAAAAPEYAFLLGFIAILVVTALAFLGESVANVLETTAERLDTMIF